MWMGKDAGDSDEVEGNLAGPQHGLTIVVLSQAVDGSMTPRLNLVSMMAFEIVDLASVEDLKENLTLYFLTHG